MDPQPSIAADSDHAAVDGRPSGATAPALRAERDAVPRDRVEGARRMRAEATC